MSFDGLAPVYRLMERLTAGRKLQRCRTAFLEAIPPPQRILSVGEGHGRFLCACRRHFPRATIVCVDASPVMLTQARRALSKAGLDDSRVQWVQADILSWIPPRESFDLVATHFFLDCFRADQLKEIIPRISTAAANGASWLVADFQVAPVGWRRIRSRAILAVMYAFFRVVTRLPAKTLISPDPYLRAAGFRLHRRMEFEWDLLKCDWWRTAGSFSPASQNEGALTDAVRPDCFCGSPMLPAQAATGF